MKFTLNTKKQIKGTLSKKIITNHFPFIRVRPVEDIKPCHLISPKNKGIDKIKLK